MEGSDGINSKVRRSKLKTLQPSKRRKVDVETSVVTVKVEVAAGVGGDHQGRQQKNEGPPSDCWSWRKYGQKPIKGSPYPRGYYKCSTSKGCLAKKQVERCRTDASLLIVTYTSTHNHPHPNPHHLPPNNLNIPQIPDQQQQQPTTQITDSDAPKQEQQYPTCTDQDHFHYSDDQSPLLIISTGQEVEIPFAENPPFDDDDDREPPNVVFDHVEEEEPLHDNHLMTFSSTPKLDQENDFFDELEELPTYSSLFTSNSTSSFSFRRSSSLFFDDRILVHPS